MLPTRTAATHPHRAAAASPARACRCWTDTRGNGGVCVCDGQLTQPVSQPLPLLPHGPVSSARCAGIAGCRRRPASMALATCFHLAAPVLRADPVRTPAHGARARAMRAPARMLAHSPRAWTCGGFCRRRTASPARGSTVNACKPRLRCKRARGRGGRRECDVRTHCYHCLRWAGDTAW